MYRYKDAFSHGIVAVGGKGGAVAVLLYATETVCRHVVTADEYGYLLFLTPVIECLIVKVALLFVVTSAFIWWVKV